MKTFTFLLLFFSFPLWLGAQQFVGDYALSTDGGEVYLELRDAGRSQLRGMLADSDGTRYQVQAAIEQEYARGILSNSQGGLYFEAILNRDQLVLTIMPPDAYNQPDYLNAKDFFLTRQERITAPINLSRENSGNTLQKDWLPEYLQDRTDDAIWEDVFYGKINDTPTQLSFSRYGNQLSGEIDAGGYKYTLEGAISGKESWGEALDPQTQNVMKFTAVLNGDAVMITFSNGQGQFKMPFWREGTEPPTSQSALGPAGEWTLTQARRSGEFAPPQRLLFLLRPDGSYLKGEARLVRTNPESRGVESGKWIAQDNFILTEYGEKWRKYASYKLEGDRLFLTIGRAPTQEWTRVD